MNMDDASIPWARLKYIRVHQARHADGTVEQDASAEFYEPTPPIGGVLPAFVDACGPATLLQVGLDRDYE